MNCDQFQSWLENRDFSDQSESDQALQHQKNCPHCKELAVKDRMLDEAIRNNMDRQQLPEHLEKIVSLNLGSSRSRFSRVPTTMIRVLSLVAGVGTLVLLFLFFPTDYSARKDFGVSFAADHIKHNFKSDLEQIDDLHKWLSVNASFRAEIPSDFASGKNYQFIGGRICLIGECRTVHLVYRKGSGLVSLYIVDASQVEPRLQENKTYHVTSKGYDIKMWKKQHQVYAVVI